MNDETTTQRPPTTDKQTPPESTPTLGDLLKVMDPYIPLIGQITSTIEAQHKSTVSASALLLFFIVLTLGILSGLSLYLGHVDTAEKILIGLLSFLGGTALFGGGTKK